MKATIKKEGPGRWVFVVPMPNGAISLTGSGWSQQNAMEMVHGIIEAKWPPKREQERLLKERFARRQMYS